VTYSYDENQRVRVQVYDADSGLRKDVAIEYRGEPACSPKHDIERKSAYLKQVRIA
jgi:hypothetical protein